MSHVMKVSTARKGQLGAEGRAESCEISTGTVSGGQNELEGKFKTVRCHLICVGGSYNRNNNIRVFGIKS